MIRLPDLRRVGKSKGDVHKSFGVNQAFDNVYYAIIKKYRPRYFERSTILDDFFLQYYRVEDAIYRRDFLSELLDREFRRNFDNLNAMIPRRYMYPVYVEDKNGEERPASAIRNDLIVVQKILNLPKTLEILAADLPGTSEASQDIRKFVARARKSLGDYEKEARPLRKKPLVWDGGMDVERANHCLRQIILFRDRIDEICNIKKQFSYYFTLCMPYEVEFNGRRVPSCKPEFLDPELREGTMKNAYHPAYSIAKKLSIPNDIHWGHDTRNTFIQGPNSMGKSVYLKTAALNIHLAMAGLFCFADSCQMSPVRQMFPCFDLGDSLGEGHFLTGLYEINDMIRRLKIEDIVFLDEAGGGTEPEAERIIAKGISDALINNSITSFNVTHDRNAWKGYKGKSGIKFLRVADLGDRKMRYKVWPGIAEGGYAMHIAKQRKIDPKSVDRRIKARLK